MEDLQNTDQQPQTDQPDFMAGALFGALVGGVAALLLTPKNGREMRDMALEYLKDWEHEAEAFKADAQEMAEAFKAALDDSLDKVETHHPDVAADVRRHADRVTEVAQQTYQAADESVSQVVEAIRTGWDEGQGRDTEEPRPYHPSVELPTEAWVKMGSAQASRDDLVESSDQHESAPEFIPNLDVASASVSEPEYEEPAFARASSHTEPGFLARREEVDEEAEASKQPKEAFKYPDWQSSSTARRTTSSQNYDMHGGSWGSPLAEAVKEIEVTTPEIKAELIEEPELQIEASTPQGEAEVTPVDDRPTIDLSKYSDKPSEHLDASSTRTTTRKTAAKRDKDGLKPLYVAQVLESRDPIEPYIQPITSDTDASSRPASKKFFHK